MPVVPAGIQPTAAVVYHPLKPGLDALRTLVDRAASRAGWATTRWYPTSVEDAGLAAARTALAEGANVILAVGGDGTVRAVAEVLRGTGVPLAVIPAGTGNLLARNVGMPLDDREATVRAAFSGRNRRIDLGVIRITREDDREDEHVFLVLAGMGLDARLISTTRQDLKRRLGWLAYVDAGVRSFFRDAPLQIQYSIDGSPARPLTVYTVMIGNCGLMPGGMLLIPDASLDDGRLDVVALRPLGPFSWLRIWHKIGWENGVLRKSRAGRQIIDLVNDTRSVTYLQAARFALSVPQAEPIQLDGDDFGIAVAANGTVDPGALVLRVLPEWRPAHRGGDDSSPPGTGAIRP